MGTGDFTHCLAYNLDVANEQRCPECGARLMDGESCQDAFYQMLYWETEDPAKSAVHHLTVLCFHLQHPSLYSPKGLKYAIHLLDDFVVRGRTPQEVRKTSRDFVNSRTRDFKIGGAAGSQGAYAHPVAWSMTDADVVAAGEAKYCESVRVWAASILETLKYTENYVPR